jgi:hypothetical protein
MLYPTFINTVGLLSTKNVEQRNIPQIFPVALPVLVAHLTFSFAFPFTKVLLAN